MSGQDPRNARMQSTTQPPAAGRVDLRLATMLPNKCWQVTPWRALCSDVRAQRTTTASARATGSEIRWHYLGLDWSSTSSGRQRQP